MDKTRMPKVAGTLIMISGVLAIVGAVPAGWVVRGVVGFGTSGTVMIPIAAVALPLLAIGVLAVMGGRSALRRRNWGLAMAGGVCAVIFLLGIPAVILLVLSKKEFT